MKWNHEHELDLVKLINQNGGWPLWATELQSVHGFSFDTVYSKNGCVEDKWLTPEWHSVIMRADEYHWLSISEEFKSQERKKILQQVGRTISLAIQNETL